jgi:SOS-response transcriptional repressor LexA
VGTKAVSFADSISKEVIEMQNNVAAYIIKPSDETDLFEAGEEILINKKKQISTNDIVVVKLKTGIVKIKRCSINESFIILVDKNLNIEQISYDQIDCMFSFYGKIVQYNKD